jgi:ABC-type sugar transport system permease subunit
LRRLAQTTARAKVAPGRVSHRLIGYIYLLPALLILTVFHIIPAGYAFWISMQGGRIRNFQFIGLDNYANALQAPEFWGALQNTVFYVLGTVPFTMGVGLIVAYLLFQKIRGRGIIASISAARHIRRAGDRLGIFNPTAALPTC